MNYLEEVVLGIPAVPSKSGKNKISQDIFISTLEYILKRYGKCLYIKILNGKIVTKFICKNPDFINEWQTNTYKKRQISILGSVHLEEPDRKLDGFLIQNYDWDYEFVWFFDMIEQLCIARAVPDVEFIFNYDRLTPVVSSKGGYADVDGYGNARDYLLFPIMFPILSVSSSDDFTDLPIPNYYDSSRMNEPFGIKNYISMKWETKNTEFLFYDNILCRFNEKTFISNTLLEHPVANSVIKIKDHDKFQVVNNEKITIQNKFKTNTNDDIENIAKSKFIVVCDSITSPQELSDYLFTGSLILRMKSKKNWLTWFDDKLKANEHYIEFDETNFESVIDWCLNNDETCKNIAVNSRYFAVTTLSKNSVLDYLLTTIKSLPTVTYGVNEEIIQMEMQLLSIANYKKNLMNKLQPIDIPKLPNNFFENTRYYNKTVTLCLNRNEHLIHFKNFDFFLKSYKDDVDAVNDAFIGMRVINNIADEIPNFCYTHQLLYRDNSFVVVREKIKGVALDIFLNSFPEKFTIIFIQICLSLQLAFERNVFEHGSLDPSHIIVNSLDKPTKIQYRLQSGNWMIETMYVPVICNFSKSKCITTFDFNNIFINKEARFTGKMENEIDKLNKLLHVNGSSDSKNLFKRLGKKVVKKITLKDSKDPESVMKAIVSKRDIVENKIKFGKTDSDIDERANVRYEYDKMSNDPDAILNVSDRVYRNPLPTGKTVLENIIFQYEITHNLKSALNDLNIKINVDLKSSEKIKKCIDFVRSFYDAVIKDTETTEYIPEETSYNLDGIMARYIIPIVRHPRSKEFIDKIRAAILYGIKEFISFSASNTRQFFEERI